MGINKVLYPILLLLVALGSCDYESPLGKEQYKETLYLIGVSNNLVTKELAYSNEVQEGFIIMGVSGSPLADGNADVTLESHNGVTDWYNKKFKLLTTGIRCQGLATNAFKTPSYTTTLGAGETYAGVPFKAKTEGLKCDSFYAVAFKITSSSAGHEINRKDSALTVSFNLVDRHSGNYIFKALWCELDNNDEIVASTSITIVRILKVTKENAMRLYSEQQAETTANTEKHAVVLKVDAGNNVTTSAWEGFDLIDDTCTYDQNSKVFSVNCKYTADDKTYQAVGTFTYQDEDAGSN